MTSIEHIRVAVKEILGKHDPVKLDRLESLFEKCKGKEEILHKTLCNKYKIPCIVNQQTTSFLFFVFFFYFNCVFFVCMCFVFSMQKNCKTATKNKKNGKKK